MKRPLLSEEQKAQVLGDPGAPAPAKPFDEWAKVELFGHQVIIGQVREATLAGGAFLRVDVPATNGNPPFTRFYGPGAIYSITPVSESVARALLETHYAPPVHRFEVLKPAAPGGDDGDAE
jgi:hypothetical protein